MKKKIAVIDFRMDKESRRNLKNLGLELIDSYCNKNIYDAISGHVDINMFTDGENIVVSPESYNYYREKFQKLGVNRNIISGKTSLSKKYPGDILYNVCYTGKYYIANFENTDYEIKSLIYSKYIKNEKIKNNRSMKKNSRENISCNLKKNNIGENTSEKEKTVDKIFELENVINIKQGYSNCSICQVDEKSVITYDEGIAKCLEDRGLDVLKISTGYIDLFDFNYGFIGGASASFKKEILFFGKISEHPDYIRIKEFVEKKGKKIRELSNGKLTDYGSMFIFEK